MKVLLTGATGFIGSNIANFLCGAGYVVLATHRTNSDFRKCIEFKSRIDWINTEIHDWKTKIKKFKPEIFIHSAWGGIDVNSRDNWETQLQNFKMSKEYFDLAEECDVKKIIAFGSQAEYGRQSRAATEKSNLQPDEAYGAVKTLTAHLLRTRFHDSPIHWYWIRIFSLFGEYENSRWLIPTVITNLLNGKRISLTECEQKYNYLYIGEFLKQLELVITEDQNKSGIYNICNKESIELKVLLNMIPSILDTPADLLRFGELPYRPNQNMLIHGNNKKFWDTFSPNHKQMIGLKEGLRSTIEHHKNKKA